MPSDELIGTELGDYRPISVLGRGGMGVVYEAEDLALRRTVALKVLAPNLLEDTTARARFQREIAHAVAIEHPHVVPVYAAGFARPHFYLATRLIRGPDLARLLSAEGALEERRALRVLGQVASALHTMHEQGMVHRDVKPANVLLWAAGQDEEHAMLTDFGIAKALNDSLSSLTGLGAVGTPAYMAPEVCLGRSAVPASDQYSLACMAFELLSGRPPFDADGVSLPDAHIEQSPMSLATAAPEVSASVAAAVDRALAKQPGERHPDVREFVRSARVADDAFKTSQAITRVMTEAARPEDTVERLSRQHGLTDAAISQITEIDRTEVVRLRRRQARQALAGRRKT
jgi:serine/threonine protein kinase